MNGAVASAAMGVRRQEPEPAGPGMLTKAAGQSERWMQPGTPAAHRRAQGLIEQRRGCQGPCETNERPPHDLTTNYPQALGSGRCHPQPRAGPDTGPSGSLIPCCGREISDAGRQAVPHPAAKHLEARGRWGYDPTRDPAASATTRAARRSARRRCGWRHTGIENVASRRLGCVG